MRIRKRFPLSSMASSVSDPQLNNSTLVQQTSSVLHPIQNMGMQHNPNTDSQPSDPPTHPLSSDQKPMIINNTLHPYKFQINQKEEASIEQEEQNGSNNTRKEYNFLAVAPVGETGVLPPLGTHQVDGRWFDGDERIPLKKRKGLAEEEEKKMKPKMRSKTNKKCSTTGMQQNHSEQDKVGNDDSNPNSNNNIVKKMNKRGGAIMEGSRCSRVNGRGWRCCQQTLVGYSLCEHHLGKGRLRSISNVKGRTKAPTVVATTITPHQTNDTTISTTNDGSTNDNQSPKNVLVSSSVVQPPVRDRKDKILLDGSCYDDVEDDDEDEDEDDYDYNEEETKKPLVVKKKRMKLGMVKARSLSSLLNQTN